MGTHERQTVGTQYRCITGGHRKNSRHDTGDAQHCRCRQPWGQGSEPVCPDDRLAERLAKAGEETGERVWRMPLASEYDKMIDSKFADMKNTGGSRSGGAITAAHFIQRFVAGKMPWAHLDIAGTGFDSRQSDINKSWGSGWGVRLLDRLVADYYEK